MYYQQKNKKYFKEKNEVEALFNNDPIVFKEEFLTNIFNEEILEIPNLTKTIRIMEFKINQVCNSISTWFQTFPDFIDNKSKYYKNFKIPKKKGGFREIDAPIQELKDIQKEILNLLQYYLEIVPHNSAYAYIKNRSTIKMAEKLKNKNCIIKVDLKNFFNSINEALLYEKLNNIANFKILRTFIIPNTNHTLLDAIIVLATKEGHLVQGNPLSPFLSNLVMLEFDYKINEAIYNKKLPKYMYTRYADDIFLAEYAFADCRKVISFIDNLLETCYHNCIKRNKEKTQYLKCTKKCYITGVKLNKDHNLTYGHEHKKTLKLNLYNLFIKYANNEATLEEVQELLGKFSYMKSIEPYYADYLERKLLNKFNSSAKTLAKHFKF